MKITIVYDNKIAENIAGLKAGWDFSCFIVPTHCTKIKRKSLLYSPKIALKAELVFRLIFKINL